jgi:hypothetical protein
MHILQVGPIAKLISFILAAMAEVCCVAWKVEIKSIIWIDWGNASA